MGGRERTLVKIIVGHDSTMLDHATPEGHLFRWNLFVRAVEPARLVDRSFISKVTFTLHESYANNVRTVREAPFEISETGHSSFNPTISIYFNYHGAKPIKYTYDMIILLEKKCSNRQEVILELKDVPPTFLEVIKKNNALAVKNKKREATGKDGSSASVAKKPKLEEKPMVKSSDKEKHEKPSKKEEKPAKDKEKKSSKSKKEKEEKKEEKPKISKKASPPTAVLSSSFAAAIAGPSTKPLLPQRPIKAAAPNKSEDRKKTKMTSSDSSSPSSSDCSHSSSGSPSRLNVEEMQRKLNNLTNEDQIYKVAKILLSHRSTVFLPSKSSLSFDLDLSSADPQLIRRLNTALSS